MFHKREETGEESDINNGCSKISKFCLFILTVKSPLQWDNSTIQTNSLLNLNRFKWMRHFWLGGKGLFVFTPVNKLLNDYVGQSNFHYCHNILPLWAVTLGAPSTSPWGHFNPEASFFCPTVSHCLWSMECHRFPAANMNVCDSVINPSELLLHSCQAHCCLLCVNIDKRNDLWSHRIRCYLLLCFCS